MTNEVHILLVEDDEVDILNYERTFRKLKITNPFSVAHNGVEALEILRKEHNSSNPLPRIILLDINMPKMGGIEFLKELRSDPDLKGLSVFVMTTSKQDKDVIAAYDLNVAGYILKPLSFESFAHAISVLDNYWKLCVQPSAF